MGDSNGINKEIANLREENIMNGKYSYVNLFFPFELGISIRINREAVDATLLSTSNDL